MSKHVSKPKYLYEINYKNGMVVSSSQYTIVYENKTYVYCKVNGTDTLLRVERRLIDQYVYERVAYTFNRDSAQIKELFLTSRIESLKSSVNSNKRVIKIRESDIVRYQKEILSTVERIKEYEEQLKALKGDTESTV